MADQIFSIHAPTGQAEKEIVSSNEFSEKGRNIGYPSKFSVYTKKLAQSDGSQSLTETREVTDIVGNRLYLYHRPLVNANGTVTTITVSGGTLDTSLTNVKQGYVVFSSLPSSTFTISYLAAPDSISMWHLNTIQDDVMEIQQVLGISNETGYPGLRNLKFGLFDTPIDPNLSGVAQRAVFLPHLSENIVIGSTDDSTLSGTLGNSHTIQIGRGLDTFIADATGIYLKTSDGSRSTKIYLGSKTGDLIYYYGKLSGEGPMTIGGPLWPNYSGTLGGSLTTGYYTGAMLRVNGDLAVLGDVQAVGSITVVNLTGEVSSVYGDFTVTDELSVYGVTHTYGLLDANEATVKNNLHLYGDLVADNIRGNGGNNQTLLDNLDASEVAHSYKTVTRKVLPNTVLNGRPSLSFVYPVNTGYTFAATLGKTVMCGDMWQITGFANATAGPSGAHPNIIQVNFADYPIPIVSGTYGSAGSIGGIWSPGMMDPGSLYLTDTTNSFTTPIYGYTIESGDSTNIYRLNLFSPELVSSNRVQTNDSILIYNKYNRPYNFISAQGGASPTFSVFASSTYPFEVSFEDDVRKMTSSTSNISLTTALANYVTGLSGVTTGTAFIFANNSSDPENAPGFKARNIPFRMPGETAVGEVMAYYSGSSWNILETTSYRPSALYDSSWLPIVTYQSGAGRSIGPITGYSKFYFNHNFGADIDAYKISTDLYLARRNTTMPTGWDQANPMAYTFATKDFRAGLGFSGGFVKVPLTNTRYAGGGGLSTARDASVFYVDSKYIGVQFDTATIYPGSDGTTDYDYLRLVVRRDS